MRWLCNSFVTGDAVQPFQRPDGVCCMILCCALQVRQPYHATPSCWLVSVITRDSRSHLPELAKTHPDDLCSATAAAAFPSLYHRNMLL
jgi:hypothetical protein